MNNNLVYSTKYLEFINNIDELVSDILYSSEDGYINLNSKQAVMNAKKYLDKFDYESEKILRGVEFNNANEIVVEKRNELIEQIKKHYSEEAINYADDVYQNMLENSFLKASIHKNNKNLIDKIYARILSCTSWIANVRNLSNEDCAILIKNNTNNFYKALLTDDKDYIPETVDIKTDRTFFINLRKLVLTDETSFLSLNIDSFLNKLSKNDCIYFKNMQTNLKNYQKNKVKDDIILVNTAIELLKLKNDNLKYDFISQIKNDFQEFQQMNKKILEQDKIDLIKRRMELFKNSIRNNTISEYFKNKITS